MPSSTTATTVSPRESQEAFERLVSLIASLHESDLQRQGVELEPAGLFAISLHQKISDSDLEARLRSLPATEFEIAHFERLGDIGLAAVYVARQIKQTNATTTDAKVPPAVLSKGRTIKARMMKLATFVFDDDPTIAPHLAHIASGSGHRDLSADLDALAVLYAEHLTILSQFPKHFVATDLDNARIISQEMIDHLTSEQRAARTHWLGQQARIWTLLKTHFNDTRDTVLWLLRREPARASQFSSLFTTK
jgi:hypothetical protein